MENAMTMRILAAAAVLVSAAVHLIMWFNGVRNQFMVGPAFMVNAVAGVAIALLLVRWRHWAPPLLAVGFGVSTLGAFVISTTVGLFGVHAHWSGGYVWTAAVAEVVAILAGGAAVAKERQPWSGGQLQDGRAVRRAHLD
jgi:hypothetical protein